MAKRFTDTNIWKKRWFRKSSPKMKCLWLFLCSSCDAAGVWEVDLDSAEFHIGEEVTREDIDFFGTRVRWIEDDKLYLTDFISFQYGVLSSKCNPHKSIIRIMGKHGLEVPGRVPDKVEEQEEVKEQVQVKEKVKELPFLPDVMCQRFFEITGKKIPPMLPRLHLKNFIDMCGFAPYDTIEGWEELFHKCRESTLLMSKKWFDIYWIVMHDNAAKVMIGRYDNEEDAESAEVDEILNGS